VNAGSNQHYGLTESLSAIGVPHEFWIEFNGSYEFGKVFVTDPRTVPMRLSNHKFDTEISAVPNFGCASELESFCVCGEFFSSDKGLCDPKLPSYAWL
jgi:hypothetical protein